MTRTTLAEWLRRLTDRIDYHGAPKAIGWSFTYEDRKGMVFREDRKGCPLWYYGDDDYKRAHTEADTAHAIVDWANNRARFGR